MTINTSISTLARNAIGAAILVAIPASALASQNGDDIIVRSQAALEEWRKDTSSDLNRLLARTDIVKRGKPNNAIVQVTFDIGEDGKAENIQLYNDEGNWAAERHAIYAVKRLRGLDEVPVTNPQDAQVLANIIFSSNRMNHDRLFERLEKMERARMASKDEASTYIALGY